MVPAWRANGNTLGTGVANHTGPAYWLRLRVKVLGPLQVTAMLCFAVL